MDILFIIWAVLLILWFVYVYLDHRVGLHKLGKDE